MLIQSGYVLPENVQRVLADKSSNQKIGYRLIQGNLISPHAFDLILAEQMNVRLSRGISEQIVKINFAATEVKWIVCLEVTWKRPGTMPAQIMPL
jgi:hypothetical protein